MEITGVHSENIPLIWEEIKPLVEKALFYTQGEYESEDIYNLLMYQQMQLWIAAEDTDLFGCVVTEIRVFPRKKVGHVVLVSGHDLDAWSFLHDTIEEWFYAQGCDFLRSEGRFGWKPKVAKLGYEPQYVIYSKCLRTDHENTH